VLTTIVLQDAFCAIVRQHIANVSCYSVWTPAKDEETDKVNTPALFWRAQDTEDLAIQAQALRPVFVIDCLFLDQTSSDRSNRERDEAHSKMNAIARQCWAKFYQTYVIASNSYQGVPLDFDPDQVGIVKYAPFWDSGTAQYTGVRLTVRIVSGAPDICEDYFRA